MVQCLEIAPGCLSGSLWSCVGESGDTWLAAGFNIGSMLTVRDILVTQVKDHHSSDVHCHLRLVQYLHFV